MIGRTASIALVFLTGATAAVFLVMALVTGPHLQSLGGVDFFDSRLWGYDKGEAQTLLRALGEDGTAFYRNIQYRIDSIFPAMLFVTLVGWLLLLGRQLSVPLMLSLVVILIALVGAFADYLENDTVLHLIELGPDGIDDEPVMTASISTVTKLICDGFVLAVMLIEGLVAAFRGRAS